MNILRLFPLVLLLGCSETSTHKSLNIFEHEAFTTKQISDELLYFYKDLTRSYHNKNDAVFTDTYLFLVEALKEVKAAQNNHEYFRVCKSAYIELEKLTELYNDEIDYVNQRKPMNVTPEMVAQEQLTYQSILKCQKL